MAQNAEVTKMLEENNIGGMSAMLDFALDILKDIDKSVIGDWEKIRINTLLDLLNK